MIGLYSKSTASNLQRSAHVHFVEDAESVTRSAVDEVLLHHVVHTGDLRNLLADDRIQRVTCFRLLTKFVEQSIEFVLAW